MPNPPPTELPRSLSTLEQIRDGFSDRIRTIVEWLKNYTENPATADQDMANKRIVNLADPRDDQDGVNLRTLKKLRPDQPPTAVTVKADASANFRVVNGKYGHVCVEGIFSGTVTFEALSVDEEDPEFFATSGTGQVLREDTQISSVINKPSRFGRSFTAGDYVLIYDPGKYEIIQILKVDPDHPRVWTMISRGLFGTVKTSHVKPKFYRLLRGYFSYDFPTTAVADSKELPWANKCVVCVTAPIGGAEKTVLLLPNNDDSGIDASFPIISLGAAGSRVLIPGLRTLNGAMYTLGTPGTIALGSVSVLRLKVSCMSSIRNLYLEFDGAAGDDGNGGEGQGTVITLAYFPPPDPNASPDANGNVPGTRMTVHQIAEITIAPSSRESYQGSQQGARFPTMSGFHWPPHLNFPEMQDALDANGVLKVGFSIGKAVANLEEDGELDFIVTKVGSNPGKDLRVTLLT